MGFEGFDRRYGLHDSYWIGAFLNVAYEPTVTLAVAWDAVGLTEEVWTRTANVADWPYLLIQLSDVEQFWPAQYDDPVGACRIISGHGIQVVDGKKMLAIDDVYGNSMYVVYRGKEVFLALDKDGKRLEI